MKIVLTGLHTIGSMTKILWYIFMACYLLSFASPGCTYKSIFIPLPSAVCTEFDWSCLDSFQRLTSRPRSTWPPPRRPRPVTSSSCRPSLSLLNGSQIPAACWIPPARPDARRPPLLRVSRSTCSGTGRFNYERCAFNYSQKFFGMLVWYFLMRLWRTWLDYQSVARAEFFSDVLKPSQALSTLVSVSYFAFFPLRLCKEHSVRLFTLPVFSVAVFLLFVCLCEAWDLFVFSYLFCSFQRRGGLHSKVSLSLFLCLPSPRFFSRLPSPKAVPYQLIYLLEETQFVGRIYEAMHFRVTPSV